MALETCRECGGQVSQFAEVCPHCGVNGPTPLVYERMKREALVKASRPSTFGLGTFFGFTAFFGILKLTGTSEPLWFVFAGICGTIVGWLAYTTVMELTEHYYKKKQ